MTVGRSMSAHPSSRRLRAVWGMFTGDASPALARMLPGFLPARDRALRRHKRLLQQGKRRRLRRVPRRDMDGG
jgi:hypothetical protein